ncbi:MAG TPA: metallophosphoesterase [Polyangiaceae bacterium]|nr:metallophosphoesterase [Polyangiaceae bacterium]
MNDRKKSPRIESIETKHLRERAELFAGLKSLDRRSFMKVSTAALAAVAGAGITPHSFQPVSIAHAQANKKRESFRFAYISDTHLYKKTLNDRFVNALLRAVDDVNAMDPPPDFVLFGGDLAQLGQPEELELGAQILKSLKWPMRVMVGEHDWYFDMGEKWQSLFGQPTYSFDHKGVHFVVLNSIIEQDFWTARNLTPMERMKTVAGLDNGIQGRFTVGDAQRAWLIDDLKKVSPATPLVVFSHSPLYKLYRPWNFWTDDAEQVQAILRRFSSVVVIHGHTHQLLTNRIGNIYFHGMLSTAWPWPYAPEGLPELTVQMGRPNPFDPQDGCGDGSVVVQPDGLVDKIYNLWNRNPVTVSRNYLVSRGRSDKPTPPTLRSF